MKTYSKHTKISANDIREINPFDYLKYYVDNIQPFTQFKDSPEIFYEGMTKEEFFVKYKEEFSNILQPIIKDERLSILQDELEEEGKEVCMFNMYLLAKFLVERGKSRYLFLLRPSISETLAALKEVSKITFTNKDNTTVETKSTMLIKKVIETLEANKEADAMNYEVERTVTWDKMSNNSIMQSYFVNDLTKFLHEYFPVKRKKDALVSTKEVELILYLMKRT